MVISLPNTPAAFRREVSAPGARPVACAPVDCALTDVRSGLWGTQRDGDGADNHDAGNRRPGDNKGRHGTSHGGHWEGGR